MVFDANLVLCDGSYDWTFARLVTSNYGSPTSLTRNSGGFVVLDLAALGGTPATGIGIVLILDDDAAVGTLTAIVQSCDALDFAAAVHELARFDLAAANSGVLLGSEAPCTVIRRVATTDRYLRVDCSLSGGADDLLTGYILVSPWAFATL